MRISEILRNQDPPRAGGPPSFSFEFFPPKTEAGEQNLYKALSELKPLDPSFVSVTYGAGGSSREKTIGIVKRIKEEFGLEAMAHFTCVAATVPELRETLDEMQRGGDRQRARAARRSAGRRGGLDEDRGRPRVLTRAGRADRRRLRLRNRRGLLPGDAHPRGERRVGSALPRREGAGGRGLPDHADVLRQRFLF